MSSIQQLQQSHIDLLKVTPIEKNRLIAFVNHFVVSVVKHLNYITNLVDSRLNVLNDKLNVCHANLIILETKLNSISGLSVGNTVDTVSGTTAVTQTATPSVSSAVEPKVEKSPTKTEENERSEEKTAEIEDVCNDATSSEEVVKEESDEANNELLAKYYKMMRIGVPLGAVQQKMIAEGLDPSLLKV